MALPPPRARFGILLLLVAAAVSVPTMRAARAGWWDDLDKGDQVKLSDLTHDADRWKDKVVTFACIYHAPDTVYQPYFTSFNAEKFLNFTAWYDGAPIWEKQSFVDDEFPYLYLARNHPQRDELLRIPSFTRIEITGRVKDVYRQRPWIDVLGLRITPATFGQNVVDRMKDGDACAANGNYARAESYYRLVADQASLDEMTRLRVTKRLEEAHRAAGSGAASGGVVLGGTSMPTPKVREDGTTMPLPDDAPVAGPAVPVTPMPDGGSPPPSGAPPALTTDDLPGTPVEDGGPRPAPPHVAVPAAPTTPAAPTGVAPGQPLPAPAYVAPGSPVPAAPAAKLVPAPTPPVVKDVPAPAEGVPPPPPPRTPRLSGVK